jgi:hypothetical protein
MSKKRGEKLFGVLAEDKAKYVPAALFIIALLLRLYYIQPGLWHTDSVIAAQEAERSVATGRLHYLQDVLGYGGFALFNTGVYLIWNLVTGGSAEHILLAANAIMGAAGAALIYLLSVKLTGSREAGVYSGVILTFLPLNLVLSTYLKDLMLGSLLVMAAALTVLKAARQDSLKLKVLAGCVLGYAAAVRQLDFLFIPSFILLYYVYKPPVELKRRGDSVKVKLKSNPRGLAFDVLSLVVPVFIVFTIPYIPRMFSQPGFNPFEALLATGGAQTKAGLSLDILSRYSIPWATKSLTQLGWIVLIGSLYVNYARNRRVWLALTAWMTSYFIIYGSFQGVSPYFFYGAFPAAVLMMGWGLAYAHQKRGDIAHVIVVALVIWMFTSINPVLSYRRGRCGPCEFSRRIAEVTPVDSALIGMDETRHYEYYAPGRKVMGHPNPLSADEMGRHFSRLHGLLANGTSVYVTSAGLSYDILPGELLNYDPERKLLGNRMTGKAYVNLVYDDGTRALVDRDSGLQLPMGGLYSLELFNEFTPTVVFTMESEDWHHKDLDLGKYSATLIQLRERGAADTTQDII